MVEANCPLKIAAPDSLSWDGPASLNGLRLATSYPRILGRWLTAHGIDAGVVTMRGAVEVAPRLKLASAICDLVSTGATLEANGLVARHDFATVPPHVEYRLTPLGVSLGHAVGPMFQWIEASYPAVLRARAAYAARQAQAA